MSEVPLLDPLHAQLADQLNHLVYEQKVTNREAASARRTAMLLASFLLRRGRAEEGLAIVRITDVAVDGAQLGLFCDNPVEQLGIIKVLRETNDE